MGRLSIIASRQKRKRSKRQYIERWGYHRKFSKLIKRFCKFQDVVANPSNFIMVFIVQSTEVGIEHREAVPLTHEAQLAADRETVGVVDTFFTGMIDRLAKHADCRGPRVYEERISALREQISGLEGRVEQLSGIAQDTARAHAREQAAGRETLASFEQRMGAAAAENAALRGELEEAVEVRAKAAAERGLLREMAPAGGPAGALEPMVMMDEQMDMMDPVRPAGEVPKELKKTVMKIKDLTRLVEGLLEARKAPQQEDPRNAAISLATRTIIELKRQLREARADAGSLNGQLEEAHTTHAAAIEALEKKAQEQASRFTSQRDENTELRTRLEAAQTATRIAQGELESLRASSAAERGLLREIAAKILSAGEDGLIGVSPREPRE